MAITKHDSPFNTEGKDKYSSQKIHQAGFLIIKVEPDNDRVKKVLSQNAIKFKEISVYSMDES